MTDPDDYLDDDDGPELTAAEAAAIRSLQRLAKKWPSTLMLASMDGALVVFRTEGDSRFGDGGSLDPNAAVAEIDGIPNTGGGF